MPLETAELAAAVARELASLAGITIPQAASDLSVASNLAETARRGGIENVRANLPGVRDESWLRDIEARLERLGIRDTGHGIRDTGHGTRISFMLLRHGSDHRT